MNDPPGPKVTGFARTIPVLGLRAIGTPMSTFGIHAFGIGFRLQRTAAGPGTTDHVTTTHRHAVTNAAIDRILAEALHMPGMEDIEFDPPEIDFNLKTPDFD